MYRYPLPAVDNSTVDTRQARRQIERLAKKRLPGSSLRTRADVVTNRTHAFSASKYVPHVGKKEIARGLRLIALGRAYG